MEAREVDGRTLRPLLSAGYVIAEGSRIVPSDQGRSEVEQVEPRVEFPASARLNDRQEDVLRAIARSRRKVRIDEFDGRVVGALVGRGLVARADQYITATDAGVRYFGSAGQGRIKRSVPTPENGRAAMIMRALEILDRALPRDAEVVVGNILAAADDVVDGFRKYARSLSRPRKRRGS